MYILYMIEAILLSGIAFVFFLISHFLWFHYRRPANRWRSIMRTFLLFLFLYTGAFWPLSSSNWLNLLNAVNPLATLFAWANGAALYILVFLGYAQFYFLIDRSVSARIMVEIEQSSEKRLRIEDIHQRYNPKHMQIRRLHDMIYGGYVVKEGEYYKNTKKGTLHARVFKFCKIYLHLYPGG